MSAVNPDSTDAPVRAFGAIKRDLHDPVDQFRSCGMTSVAMESAGVYQIPTFEILEQHALPSEAPWIEFKKNNVRVHAQFSMTMALCYLVKHPILLGA